MAVAELSANSSVAPTAEHIVTQTASDRTVTTIADDRSTADTARFPFFLLPRELRDEIYDRALDFKRRLPSQHHARLRVRRSARINLLLINRQFHDEYSERARRRTTLVVVDRDEFLGQKLTLSTPMIKPIVTHLEVHLALACNDVCHVHPEGCRVKRELRMHRRWIADVVHKMRGLESVVIKIVLDPHEHVSQCERLLETEQYRLAGLETLTDMQVFHCEYETCSTGWNFTKQRKMVMSWDEQRRTLVKLERDHDANPATVVASSATKSVV